MLYPTTPPRPPPAPPDRRRRRAALLLIAFVTVRACWSTGRTRQHRCRAQSSPRPDAAPVRRRPVGVRARRSCAPTSDPEVFAREVAEALFAWDTAHARSRRPTTSSNSSRSPTRPASPRRACCPTSANYLPTHDAWPELREYQTRQWLDITSVAVPDLWAEAVDAGRARRAAARHRGVHRSTASGTAPAIWEGAPVTSAHDVAFTVFVVCGPSYPDVPPAAALACPTSR